MLAARTQDGIFFRLYLEALRQNPELADLLMDCNGFTDIEFNPNRQINCQAAAAAFNRYLWAFVLTDLSVSDIAYQKLISQFCQIADLTLWVAVGTAFASGITSIC